MAAPIYNPRIPYCEPIPGGPLTPGRMVRIQAASYPNASRFAINLQVGPNVNPRDDIAMHLNARFDENCIVRNSLIYQSWGDEDRSPNFMPLQRGANFEILLLCEQSEYKIAVNGQHLCEFRHRMAPQNVTHLAIDGDVNVTLIGFEGSAPAGGYMPSPNPSYGAPQPQQGAYGAPPGGYGAAPSPYGAPPSPYGAPPGGYGQSTPGGYGPPPPPYGAAGPGPYPPHGGGGGSGGGGMLGKASGAAAGVLGGLGLGSVASKLPGMKSSGGYPSSGGGYPGGAAGYGAPGYGAPGYAASGYQKEHKKHKKDKKSKLAKYGIPLAAGVGGAYALSKVGHGFGHGFGHGHGSGSDSDSSSSSSSSSGSGSGSGGGSGSD